jgi:hypothetical protein
MGEIIARRIGAGAGAGCLRSPRANQAAASDAIKKPAGGAENEETDFKEEANVEFQRCGPQNT